MNEVDENKLAGFVVSVEDNDFKRSRLFACVYCGNTTDKTRDHIISVAWSGHGRHYGKGDTVPACRECNLILKDIPIHCISARAAFIASKLENKYRKFLQHPYWTNAELKEMSSRFRFVIKSANSLKKFIQARIRHAVLMSFEEEQPSKLKQQTLQEVDVYKILYRCFNGESYSKIESHLSLKKGHINRIIKSKQYASIIIAFKFENGIAFDESLQNVFKNTRRLRAQEQKKTPSRASKRA